jgi:trans-L-3-hydroxyproline dehydratase
MAGVEAGLFPLTRESCTQRPGDGGEDFTLRLDTPAGRVTASTHFQGEAAVGGTIRGASFLNVPSFVHTMDERVQVPGLGKIPVDVAFGGAFYAFCEAEALGVLLDATDFRELIDVGMRVK